MRSWRWLAPTLYIIFLMLPIYWLLNMSFKTTNEILGGFTLWPNQFTLENYAAILCGFPDIYGGAVAAGRTVAFDALVLIHQDQAVCSGDGVTPRQAHRRRHCHPPQLCHALHHLRPTSH